MELDDEVEVAQANIPRLPVSVATMEMSETGEGAPDRRVGMPERRGGLDQRRMRGHATSGQGDRGDGVQHAVKMADSGFYNAFDDDFDESDMKLSGKEI